MGQTGAYKENRKDRDVPLQLEVESAFLR